VLGDATKRNFFVAFGASFILVAMGYIYSLAAEHFGWGAPISKEVTQDLEVHYNEAMATSKQAKVKELHDSMKEYAPEYTSILKNISLKNADLSLDIPEAGLSDGLCKLIKQPVVLYNPLT
jgi:hypothetical protein